MNKFTRFFKRTLFVILPALFAWSLSIGQLHDIKPTFADDEPTSSEVVDASYDIENEIYTIKKTGDNSLQLLFNANPRVYKNFRKHHLEELKDALMEILKDIVHTKITDLSKQETIPDTESVDGKGGEEDKPEQNHTGILSPDTPELYHTVDHYVSLETYGDMVLEYTDIDETTGRRNLHQVIDSIVVGYAFFWVKDQIGRNQWENTPEVWAEVFNDFCAILSYRLQGKFGVTAREVYNQFYACGEEILRDGFQITLNHITGMLLLIQERDPATNELGVRDLLASVGGQRVKDEIDEIVNSCSRAQLITFFTQTPVNVIQAVVREINFNGNDLNNVIETVGVQAFIEVAKEIGVNNTRDIIQAIPDFDKNEFIDKVTEITTAVDVWSAIEAIHIDDVKVMEDKQFKFDKIVELIKHLPPLSKLAELPDDQWRHEFHIVLDTAVDEVVLDVDLGFKGNCKYLRKAAKIINDHVKFSYVGNDLTLEVNVPDFLASMYRYLIEADFLSDDLKHELWDLAFSNVQEAYEHVHAKTIEDLKLNAEDVDYHQLAESIISADEIKEFFGISRFVTQERVDKFIDLVFKIIKKGSTFDINSVYELVDDFYEVPEDLKDQIDKIYKKAQSLLQKIADRNYNAQDLHDLLSEYTSEEFNERVNNKIDFYLENAKVQRYYSRFQRLLEKIYNRVPERFRSKTIMEFYRGEGTWSGSGSAKFNITKIIRKIPKIGPKLADTLSALFDKLPNEIHANLTFSAEDLYRISYHIGNETKTGALPSGVDATFFANRNSYFDGEKLHDIVGWAQLKEDSYTYLLDMPKEDVDAYPIWFNSSVGVSKTYDGLESTIEVTPNIEIDHPFGYVWYKDGQILVGETSSSITVVNHKDSGTYYCVVDGVKQDDIIVSIDRVGVDFPTQTETITYDGNAHDYYTTFGETSEDNLVYFGTGDVSATEPGEYSVNLAFKDDDTHVADNYQWNSPTDGIYHYVIGKAVIEVDQDDLIWNYSGPKTYNGEEQSVTLYEDLLPAGVHAEYTGNAYTNAGEYTANVTIVADDPAHYEVVGYTQSSQDWVIEKAVIVIPASVELIENSFVYTGQEYTVSIDTRLLPEGITGVNYSGTRTASEVGQYVVGVSYEYDTTNYVLDDSYQKEFNWTITNRIIDVSNVIWDYTGPFTYDGEAHKVSLIQLPTGVKVNYQGNVQTAAGTYIAYATMYCAPGNQLVYKGEIRETVELTLTWTIAENPIPIYREFYSVEENENGDPYAWVSLSKGIKGEHTLHAEDVDPSQYDIKSIVQTGTVDVVVLYDINLYDADGNIVSLNVDASGKVIDEKFTFTVRILVPETHKDHELTLIHIDESGAVSKLEAHREGNYLVFTTNHLSIYGIVETHVAGSNPFPYAIVAALGAFSLQATSAWILIVLAKRKRRTVKDTK